MTEKSLHMDGWTVLFGFAQIFEYRSPGDNVFKSTESPMDLTLKEICYTYNEQPMLWNSADSNEHLLWWPINPGN